MSDLADLLAKATPSSEYYQQMKKREGASREERDAFANSFGAKMAETLYGSKINDLVSPIFFLSTMKVLDGLSGLVDSFRDTITSEPYEDNKLTSLFYVPSFAGAIMTGEMRDVTKLLSKDINQPIAAYTRLLAMAVGGVSMAAMYYGENKNVVERFLSNPSELVRDEQLWFFMLLYCWLHDHVPVWDWNVQPVFKMSINHFFNKMDELEEIYGERN